MPKMAAPAKSPILANRKNQNHKLCLFWKINRYVENIEVPKNKVKSSIFFSKIERKLQITNIGK